MAYSTCWRCLSKASDRSRLSIRFPPSNPRIPTQASTTAFSTSASLRATPLKKLPGRASAPPVRDRRATFTMKKKKRPTENRAKKPEIGERRALKKRIVLSNTNALEVKGMKDVSAESIFDMRLRGEVLGIPGQVVDQLRAVEAFKVTQGWGLFRRPGMLIRKETVEYGKLIEELSQEGYQKTVRRVLLGEKGSGKSMMLLQAMTMAFLKGWTVINIPEAQDLTLGHTEYGPIPQTSPTLYTQKTYTASLLSRISRSNPHLATITISAPPPLTSALPNPIPPNITLSRLATLGAQDPDIAHEIFKLLYNELTLPSRPPLLLCLDSLAHAMKPNTGYLSPTLKPIHAQDLYLLDWFCAHLSGASPLPNGGLVLAATSQSNAPVIPSLEFALARLSSPQQSAESTPSGLQTRLEQQFSPYTAYDERVLSIFDASSSNQKIERHTIPGLTRSESRGLMEYWARSGVLRQRITEGFVGEKWTLSGGGVVGELERAVIRC